jgi:hypothetical protein
LKLIYSLLNILFQLVTANCKRVAKADNLASNGVIHVVTEVLKPVTDTLMELIQKNPELSTLKTGKPYNLQPST